MKWALVSGLSEPIGAALGWLVLYRIMNDVAYGVVFGLVAGDMGNFHPPLQPFVSCVPVFMRKQDGLSKSSTQMLL